MQRHPVRSHDKRDDQSSIRLDGAERESLGQLSRLWFRPSNHCSPQWSIARRPGRLRVGL